MYKRMPRLFGLFGLLLVLSLALAACPASAPAADEGAAAESTGADSAEASEDSGETVTLTVATVNNPDMQVMQGFTDQFQEAYPRYCAGMGRAAGE